MFIQAKYAMYHYIVYYEVDAPIVYEQTCSFSLTFTKIKLLQWQTNHDHNSTLAGNSLDWSSTCPLNLVGNKIDGIVKLSSWEKPKQSAMGKKSPKFENTWESVLVQLQFRHLHLEDKVNLLGGGIDGTQLRKPLQTYSRRQKGVKEGGKRGTTREEGRTGRQT